MAVGLPGLLGEAQFVEGEQRAKSQLLGQVSSLVSADSGICKVLIEIK